jgi:hypothetical protein
MAVGEDMRIYKYPLAVEDKQKLVMPVGAKILSVQMQFDRPVLWAMVDERPETVEETRTFVIVCTGNPVPDDVRWFLGTVQAAHGHIVFHVFEK